MTILNQIKRFHALPSQDFKVRFSIILPFAEELFRNHSPVSTKSVRVKYIYTCMSCFIHPNSQVNFIFLLVTIPENFI